MISKSLAIQHSDISPAYFQRQGRKYKNNEFSEQA